MDGPLSAFAVLRPAFCVMSPPTHLYRSATLATSPYSPIFRRIGTFASSRPLLQDQPAVLHAKVEVVARVSSTPTRPICRVYDLRAEYTPYHKGWDLQHALADELKQDPEASDALILLEHEPVYTLGTASRLENVLFNAREVRRDPNEGSDVDGMIGDAIIVRTERGGEVTYHGPGQLVVYPILNLRRHKMDLHWYLRSLEHTVIDMMEREYNIHADRKDGLTGVWVGNEKVCAMGLKVSKWVTMHGLAINVHTDLKPFSRIIPCGISDHGVSSLHQLLSRDVCLHRARECLIESFDDTFGPYEFITAPLPPPQDKSR